MFFLGAIFHEFGVDEIGIVVVEDEEILAAADGGDDKTSCLIGVDLPSGREAGGIEVLGFECWGAGWRGVVGGR